MVTQGGRVKVLDFGLARVGRISRTDHVSSRGGVVLGTPEYVAPEQAFDARRQRSRCSTNKSNNGGKGLLLPTRK